MLCVHVLGFTELFFRDIKCFNTCSWKYWVQLVYLLFYHFLCLVAFGGPMVIVLLMVKKQANKTIWFLKS